MDERPNKRLENGVRSKVKGTFKVHHNPTSLRRVWKFGVFNKENIGLGCLLVIVGLMYLMSAVDLSYIYLALLSFGWAVVGLCSGCIKYERQR